MADVFVSYRRSDQTAVQSIVRGLREVGLSVWWDQDIAPDASWELTIEGELKAARAVIVAWSRDSTASENVKAEARVAQRGGRLLQVFLDDCEPPLFFGERQGVNLAGWTGNVLDPRFQTVAVAVRAIASGKTPPRGVGHAPRPRWMIAASSAVLVLIALSLFANIGGVRDSLCGLSRLTPLCRPIGLVSGPPPDPKTLAIQARAQLIRSLIGAWDRQGRSCVDPITITTSTDRDGMTRITVSGAKGFRSTGQVIAADNGVVVSRGSAGAHAGARDEWEYHPNGDEMTVLDKDGTATTLVRCPGRS